MKMSKLKSIYLGSVNPPIYQASTIAFDSLADLAKADKQYGRVGTETNEALALAISKLENAAKTIITSSGVSAITHSLLPLLKTGDHILVCDTAYLPTHFFCNGLLNNFGITTSYYDAKASGDDITKLIQDNTKLIFLESPSSLVYEIQELDEIVQLAKDHNIITAIDNTWAAGELFKPLDIGIDISIQSLSKYCGGHSDVLLGSISFKNEKLYSEIWDSFYQLGNHASPQDCYLAYRGLQTLATRLNAHQESALKLAKFLEARNEIKEVIYPGLDSFVQKERFEKYFKGGNGLISFTFADKISQDEIKKFVDNLQYFKIGFSWGGYESLVMYYPDCSQKISDNYGSTLVRIHVGLENVNDLEVDLTKSLENSIC